MKNVTTNILIEWYLIQKKKIVMFITNKYICFRYQNIVKY